MASAGERLSRLEGGYEHVATKADLAELRAEMQAMETRIIKWMIGAILTSAALAASVALLIQRIIGG